MQDFHRIVVPVDFHRHTDTVADYARRLATRLGAGVVFVHVVQSLARSLAATDLSAAVYGDMFPPALVEIDADLLKLARQRMQELVERYRADLAECAGEVLEGDPADRIVASAADRQADLIVMGTHGQGALGKLLLGSVSTQVLARCTVPVLLVR